MKVSRILATGAAILAAVMVVSAPAHGAGTTDDTDQAVDINPVVSRSGATVTTVRPPTMLTRPVVGQALIGAATSPRTAL